MTTSTADLSSLCGTPHETNRCPNFTFHGAFFPYLETDDSGHEMKIKSLEALGRRLHLAA